MANLFQPSVSYWAGTGTQVSQSGIPTPSTALNQSKLVLLIHGYNNTQEAASASFSRFLSLQQNTRNVNANLVGVYWPGANWEGPFYYMQSIGKVLQVAPILAQDLYQAARARGFLKIDIVAHSLGARLALETVKQLLLLKQTDPALGGLVIGQVAFMAGAVPTDYLEKLAYLRNAISSYQSTMSLFSENDIVLHWAFPLGQSAAGEGFFPVALGRKQWFGDSFLSPLPKQVRNVGAGHGDYWGGDSKKIKNEQFAADTVGNFLSLGSPLSRVTAQRDLAYVRDTPDRSTPVGRSLPSRV
jgi:pimeloyl-ACP methyl ester carboxylesterase